MGLEHRGSASRAVDRFYALCVHKEGHQLLARGVCPASSLNLLVSVKKGRFRQRIAFDIAAEILKQMPSVTDPFAAQVIVASISAFASLDHSAGTGARGSGLRVSPC